MRVTAARFRYPGNCGKTFHVETIPYNRWPLDIRRRIFRFLSRSGGYSQEHASRLITVADPGIDPIATNVTTIGRCHLTAVSWRGARYAAHDPTRTVEPAAAPTATRPKTGPKTGPRKGTRMEGRSGTAAEDRRSGTKPPAPRTHGVGGSEPSAPARPACRTMAVSGASSDRQAIPR
jgi:hypothetical protein